MVEDEENRDQFGNCLHKNAQKGPWMPQGGDSSDDHRQWSCGDCGTVGIEIRPGNNQPPT